MKLEQLTLEQLKRAKWRAYLSCSDNCFTSKGIENAEKIRILLKEEIAKRS